MDIKTDNIILSRGVAVEVEKTSAAMPLGIEYEKLMKNLKDNVERRYDGNSTKDLRKNKKFDSIPNYYDHITKPEDNKTFLINPGTKDNKITFDEPNGKPAYPQSGIPYSQGQIWSD